MKNPHTLPDLRKLLTRAERTLTSPKISKKLPTKTYNELASIRGLEITEYAPNTDLTPIEQGASVLRLIRNTLNRVELDALAEW